MSIFKNLLLIIILLGKPIHADDKLQLSQQLRPLSEVLAQEQSLHMMNYIFQRCSALMMEMAQRTERGGKREGSEQLISIMSKGYETFAMISAESISDIKGRSSSESSESLTEALETILKIHKMYFQEMESEYLKSGNAINEKTQQDMNICVELLRGK
jgi:hypothetical protein